MRTYYITVRTFEAAIDVDPLAKYVRTLPATTFQYLYCCQPPSSHPVREAYIYQVSVRRRADAEKAPGVIRCRAKEPEKYKTSFSEWVC